MYERFLCVFERDSKYTHFGIDYCGFEPLALIELSMVIVKLQQGARGIEQAFTFISLPMQSTHLYNNTLDSSSRHVFCFGRIYSSSSNFGNVCVCVWISMMLCINC